MNKLLTTTPGQMPIYLDDFRFLDDIYRQGIESIIKTYANNIDCIIYGCEIVPILGGVQVNNGVIWYQNELFAFVGGTLTGTGVIPCFQIEEIEQSPRVFGNGQIHNAHLIRRMKLVNGTSNKITDLPSFKKLVKDDANSVGEWIPLSFISNEYVSDPNDPPKYRKILNGKMVHLKGTIIVNNHSGMGSAIGIIQEGYRPAGRVDERVSLEFGMAGDASIRIQPDGYIKYNGISNTNFSVNIIYALD